MYVYVHLYRYIYIHIRMHMRTHTHTYLHTCMHAYMHSYIHIHTDNRTRHMHTYIIRHSQLSPEFTKAESEPTIGNQSPLLVPIAVLPIPRAVATATLPSPRTQQQQFMRSYMHDFISLRVGLCLSVYDSERATSRCAYLHMYACMHACKCIPTYTHTQINIHT